MLFADRIRRRRNCLLLTVDGARRGNEDNHLELLSVLHCFAREIAANQVGKIVVVGTDDFSVFFHDFTSCNMGLCGLVFLFSVGTWQLKAFIGDFDH